MTLKIQHRSPAQLFGTGAVVLCLWVVAWTAEAELPESGIFPPTMVAPDLSTLDCRARRGTQTGGERQFKIQFVVSRKGKAEYIGLDTDSPDWVKGVAECVLRKANFKPATEKGQAFDQSAVVTMTFSADASAVDGRVSVSDIGPLVSTPILYRRPGHRMHCYPVGADIPGESARILVKLTIDAEGIPREPELPAASSPWVEAAVICTLRRLAFYPATRAGVPEQGLVLLPIVFPGPGEKVPTPMRVIPPALASSDSELSKARMACLSDGQAFGRFVHLAFTIGAEGEAIAPLVLKGTGNPVVDAAAECVLEQLRFTPVRIGSQRQHVVVTWALDMKPGAQ